MPSTRPLFAQIDDWLKEIDTVKTAAAKVAPKKAGVKKAAPDGMGETSHPSEDVDDNTHDEETGSRFEENSSDVKKDVPGQAVDETDPNSGGDQDDKQYNIGTNQSAVGEDPSVEDDYKGDKDDPGTSHPMNADDTGEKYSSMKIGSLIKLAEAKAHEILADLANGISNEQRPQAKAPIQKAAAAKAPVTHTRAPVNSGYEVASAVSMDKLASEFVAQAIKDADLDADLVGAFLHSYHQTKRAEEIAPESEEGGEQAPSEEGPPPEAAGGPPVGGDAGGDPLAALAGGAGGGPPVDLAGAAAGGPPPGGDVPPGADGGGMGQEQALQELAMALQELGISPDELAQLAGGAGAPPGAADEGQKLASYTKKYKLSGKFRMEEAKSAAQRQARNQIKDYIREIAGLKN